MKTLLKITSYLFVVLLVSTSACKKQKLPSGDHSFYCYIDGELFVPKGEVNLNPKPYDSDGLTFLQYDEFFRAQAKNYPTTIMFNIVNWGRGTHHLSESTDYYDFNTNHAMARVNGIWYKSKSNSGSVTFTESRLDGDDNTMGTFEFTLYNENDDSDVIHVTGGHFDD